MTLGVHSITIPRGVLDQMFYELVVNISYGTASKEIITPSIIVCLDNTCALHMYMYINIYTIDFLTSSGRCQYGKAFPSLGAKFVNNSLPFVHCIQWTIIA